MKKISVILNGICFLGFTIIYILSLANRSELYYIIIMGIICLLWLIKLGYSFYKYKKNPE